MLLSPLHHVVIYCQLSETIVPVSKQAIDENIRVILEKLQHGLVEDQEKYKEHCVDQITQREKELVKAFSALSPTDEVIKDSAGMTS